MTKKTICVFIIIIFLQSCFMSEGLVKIGKITLFPIDEISKVKKRTPRKRYLIEYFNLYFEPDDMRVKYKLAAIIFFKVILLLTSFHFSCKNKISQSVNGPDFYFTKEKISPV